MGDQMKQHTSLAAKYRPKQLSDFHGNRETVSALKALMGRNDIPHTILFTGPSGCGKTTLARIVAAQLKCSDFDFVENNAADFRGIDSARDILRQMQLRPMSGPCRVWLLDECHQLSKDAQHAILKALEDTPDHVYFLLATTDPEKLLPTIRTRCVTFSVTALSDDEMTRLIENAVEAENAVVPEDVIEQIVEDSLGSARMALSILDKIIGMPQDEMLRAAKHQAAQANEAIELCRALIAKQSWKQIAKLLQGISQDPEQVRRAILGYAQAVLLKSGNGQAYLVLSAFREPLYDLGKPGLALCCYEAING
jgi:DNA polymerase III gamma/tau subunit